MRRTAARRASGRSAHAAERLGGPWPCLHVVVEHTEGRHGGVKSVDVVPQDVRHVVVVERLEQHVQHRVQILLSHRARVGAVDGMRPPQIEHALARDGLRNRVRVQPYQVVRAVVGHGLPQSRVLEKDRPPVFKAYVAEKARAVVEEDAAADAFPRREPRVWLARDARACMQWTKPTRHGVCRERNGGAPAHRR